jgi:hypothetical protein
MAAPVTLPSIYQSIAAPAGANPVDVQSTRDQMAMTYAPQESSITNTINQLNQVLGTDIQTQQQYGQVADQKISDIGNQVAQKLQSGVGAIGDIFSQGTQKIGSAYDEAANTVNQSSQSIMDRIKSSAGQLGQTQALKADAYGNDPISRLMANQATQQSRIATGKAGSLANIGGLGTALQGIAQKAVGDSVQNYAQKRADVATQVLKVIGQLQTTTNQSIATQLQKFSDLAQTEGPAFRTLLSQATTSRNAADRQAANDAFSHYIQAANLGIAQQNADAKNDPTSLDNIIKGQTIQKNQAGLDSTLTYKDDASGTQDLMDFVNDQRVNAKNINGTQYAGILNFINQGAPIAGSLNVSPYTYLVQQAQGLTKGNTVDLSGYKSSGSTYGDAGYQVPLNTLLEALKLRYQNVGTAKQIGAKVK